jgi:hypothetical protein
MELVRAVREVDHHAPRCTTASRCSASRYGGSASRSCAWPLHRTESRPAAHQGIASRAGARVASRRRVRTYASHRISRRGGSASVHVALAEHDHRRVMSLPKSKGRAADSKAQRFNTPCADRRCRAVVVPNARLRCGFRGRRAPRAQSPGHRRRSRRPRSPTAPDARADGATEGQEGREEVGSVRYEPGRSVAPFLDLEPASVPPIFDHFGPLRRAP